MSRLNNCSGLVYRENGKIITNKTNGKLLNLDELPNYAWHLSEIFKYNEIGRWSINTSRGCPYSCVFCSTSAFNGSKRTAFMSIEKLIKNIKRIISIEGGNNEPVSIGFSDDAFTSNRSRIIGFCNKIIEEGIKIVWSCNTRIDLIDKPLLELMHKAGCSSMLLGIESCDNEVLMKIGKKFQIEEAFEIIKIAKAIGIEIRECFILGLPFEKKESINQIKDFFMLTEPEEIRLGLLAAYPGTPIFDSPDKYGINILTNDWSKYELFYPITDNTIQNADELYKSYIEINESHQLYKYRND